MALKERQVIQISWDKPGTVVHGVLRKVKKINFSDGPGLRYVVGEQQTGMIVTFPGSSALDILLSTHDIGKIIRVEYVGLDATKEPKPGYSPAKVFRVAVDEESGKPDFDPALITDDDIPF